MWTPTHAFICNFRLFGLSSAFVASLATIWKPLPLIVLGSPSVVAGILANLLPETRGTSLPETVEEAVALGEKPERHQNSGYVILAQCEEKEDKEVVGNSS